MNFSQTSISLLLCLASAVPGTGAAVAQTGTQPGTARPVLSAPPPARPQTEAPAAVRPAPAFQVPGQSPTEVPGSRAPGQPDDSTMALPAAGAAGVPPTYVIGAEDALVVNVWKEPGLSGTLPVRPDGMISLPLVGDLRAAGFTPMQLAEDISTRLKKFVNDPNVTVTVTGVNSKKVYLIGEVGHVGPQSLTAGLTPLEAIATAGGLAPFANAKHIYILRTVNGKQEKIPFDYKKAIKTGDGQGIVLKPDDKIVVP